MTDTPEKIDWSRYDALLGKVEDRLVATAAQCTVQAVYQRRRKLGIAAVNETVPAAEDAVADALQQCLAIVMDARTRQSWNSLARHLGVDEKSVRRWRTGENRMDRSTLAMMRRWIQMHEARE